MQLTTLTLLSLSAALSLAAPGSRDLPTDPPLPADFGLAIPVEPLDTAPTTNSTSHHALRPRQGYGPRLKRVRYCQHANGAGNCLNQDINAQTCYNFASWWNDRISSIYVNPGTQCWLFSDRNCHGKDVTVLHPGIGNMKLVGMNDAASSIKCAWYFA
ncbi:beta gamma crystallin protein [Neofusicoccum parvum]|uniref:Beta gamma crystallin protein n=2 Tax=Neofusicoccum parvum TaxID=310453 RepID=A0ACB5SBE5_9PEZI|nr:putative beta gamma crystallin protein [Neofusicoccum parvum UCRNP2]GME33430.1 beta gamma crystallin protein [Neofusicoccum parvum]GME55307.1 beta gamma crystallin protein [Neofusicoccum parvum]